MLNHETRPVLVWADIDVGVSDMVEYLNTITGLRTLASCQGTIGECGAHPYRPHVMCEWPPFLFGRLRKEFDITLLGENWGYLHPKDDENIDGVIIFEKHCPDCGGNGCNKCNGAGVIPAPQQSLGTWNCPKHGKVPVKRVKE